MELRVLRYFLAVAREESFTRAADVIHVTQPTLSRQIRDLEEEIGRPLFDRSTRHLRLTGDGILFRKRAEEVVTLLDKATKEISGETGDLSGDITIGCGESRIFSDVLAVASEMQAAHPEVHFHLVTGDGADLIYQMERGLIEFAFLYGALDPAKYAAIPLKRADRWGAYLPETDPLAAKECVSAADLTDRPLILPRGVLSAGTHGDGLRGWFERPFEALDIVNTYSMIFNASLMARAGMGCLVSFDDLLTDRIPGLVMRPLDPPVYERPSIVWKKYQRMPAATEAFLKALQKALA